MTVTEKSLLKRIVKLEMILLPTQQIPEKVDRRSKRGMATQHVNKKLQTIKKKAA